MRELLVTIPVLLALLLQARAAGPDVTAPSGMSIRITSPLGRTGTPGAIRIVAQIRAEDDARPGPVRFAVDGQLLATDADGPPYVAEWVDENPFERREITVETTDALGRELRDRVVLEPFDLIDETQVTSVLLEASVQDKQGRTIKGIAPSQFTILEDGVRQQVDLAQQEAVGVTFALLIDSSRSLSRRLDFVQRTAATLADSMTPVDQMIVAPFSNAVGALTGPTDDRKTLHEAIGSIVSTGGTAILDSLAQLSNTLAKVDGRRAIVLITDGYDEHSVLSIDDALAAAKAARATVYVIGIGGVAGVSFKGEKILRRIAAETGARASSSFEAPSQTTCVIGTSSPTRQAIRSGTARGVRSRCGVTYPSSWSERARGISRQNRAPSNQPSSLRPGTRWGAISTWQPRIWKYWKTVFRNAWSCSRKPRSRSPSCWRSTRAAA
jgi:hypothetical protein